MPCTAKKIERLRDKNIDAAITVVEITDYLKELHYTKEDFQVEQDDDRGFDIPYHFCSGSAFIFGRTGGVGVSVLRQAAYQSGAQVPEIVCSWEENGLKYTTAKCGDTTLTLCVAAGGVQMAEAVKLVLSHSMKADIIEQMACPFGCCSGGG